MTMLWTNFNIWVSVKVNFLFNFNHFTSAFETMIGNKRMRNSQQIESDAVRIGL